MTADAHPSDDMALKELLFSPMAKAWFPDGVQDPRLAVLLARVESAEYWDVKQSKLVQLFAMAKAVITGEQPDAMVYHQQVPL